MKATELLIGRRPLPPDKTACGGKEGKTAWTGLDHQSIFFCFMLVLITKSYQTGDVGLYYLFDTHNPGLRVY